MSTIPANTLISLKTTMNANNITAVIRAINPSRLKATLWDNIGPATAALIASIPPIFHILAPSTVPTPISGFPVKMAIMAEPNSGRDVPIADAVIPNKISDTPKYDPKSTKLLTKISAAFKTSKNAANNTMIRTIHIILSLNNYIMIHCLEHLFKYWLFWAHKWFISLYLTYQENNNNVALLKPLNW